MTKACPLPLTAPSSKRAPAAASLLGSLALRASDAPLAALIVDYGHSESSTATRFRPCAAIATPTRSLCKGRPIITAHVISLR